MLKTYFIIYQLTAYDTWKTAKIKNGDETFAATIASMEWSRAPAIIWAVQPRLLPGRGGSYRWPGGPRPPCENSASSPPVAPLMKLVAR